MGSVYDVEAILRRKQIYGRVFYRIKWLNYNGKFNTWESEDDIFCDGILEKFVISRANKIISEWFFCVYNI